MMRTRAVIAIVVSAVVGFAACKGETKFKTDPTTQTNLDACNEDKKAKDKRIAELQEENADLMRKSGSGAEIVVSIEGNVLTVHPPKAGAAAPPVDDKVTAAASKQFVDLVQKSRGSIQKCYEHALKADTGLQAKTVTLTVSASFTGSGAYQQGAFNASQPLGEKFDSCMKDLAAKWSLPTNSPAMTFRAQVSLTPS